MRTPKIAPHSLNVKFQRVMPRIYFYAAKDDNLVLREFIDSLGLNVFPDRLKMFGKTKSVAKEIFHGYITHLDSNQLKTLKNRQICYIIEPLIWWTPSSIVVHEGENYIVQGCLEWAFNDSARIEDTKVGKTNFNKISRWIRNNWPPHVKRGTCRGPYAQKLIQYQGYLPRGLPPNIGVEYVKI